MDAHERCLESIASLRLKVKAQQSHIEALESGSAYAALEQRCRGLVREYEAKIKRLERELRERERLNKKMADAWFEVFEQVQKEADEAVGNAMEAARLQRRRAISFQEELARAKEGLREAGRRIQGLEAALEDLKGQNAKLTAQARRDFENSSLPSSLQGPRRKKIPNTRVKTGRRPGAQEGHPHHPRKGVAPTRTVMLEDPGGWEADPDLYRTGAAVSKIVVSARIAIEATEYVAGVWRRRSTGARMHAPFPEGVRDEVCYDGSVKALAFLLTCECCVSLEKTKRFLREASGGALDPSCGMISQLCREFSAKAAPERADALSRLMAHPVMHADFTSANVSGDARQVLILANPGACMMLASETKGHKGIEGTALQEYAGCCVHDHDTTFYSYGTSHQECMQHNVRYLTGSVQNEPGLAWNKEMLSLVRRMLHWRGSVDAGAMSREEIGEAASAFERRYDEVLELAASEYKESPPTKYYREGYNLFCRLRDYKESELWFLRHLEVPPDNSLCERLARVFKRKQHQEIAFRSFESLGCTTEAISLINNMRMDGEDVFQKTSAIFDRPMQKDPASN